MLSHKPLNYASSTQQLGVSSANALRIGQDPPSFHAQFSLSMSRTSSRDYVREWKNKRPVQKKTNQTKKGCLSVRKPIGMVRKWQTWEQSSSCQGQEEMLAVSRKRSCIFFLFFLWLPSGLAALTTHTKLGIQDQRNRMSLKYPRESNGAGSRYHLCEKGYENSTSTTTA